MTGNAYALPTKDLRVKENKSMRSISEEDIIRLFKKPAALKLSQSVYRNEMMGLIGAGNNPRF